MKAVKCIDNTNSPLTTVHLTIGVNYPLIHASNAGTYRVVDDDGEEYDYFSYRFEKPVELPEPKNDSAQLHEGGACQHLEKYIFTDRDGNVRCSDCHKVIFEPVQSEPVKEKTAEESQFIKENKMGLSEKQQVEESLKSFANINFFPDKTAEQILEEKGFKIFAHKGESDAIRKVFIDPVLDAMNTFASQQVNSVLQECIEEIEAKEKLAYPNPVTLNELGKASKQGMHMAYYNAIEILKKHMK